MSTTRGFPVLLEAFFVDRLLRQRQVSPHTIASYRDTFRLLLQYAQQQLGKAPSRLALSDLDSSFLGAFLDHLEQERDNSARSRNVRLAAIHSFFRYVALHAPEHSALAQRVLAMPSKRYVRSPIAFLNSVEVAALLAAPDLNSWGGRRDRALLLLAVQTGLRAAELIGLCCDDIVLGPAAYVRCRGKGRKLRNTPLRKDTVAVLRAWVRERQGQPTDPALPNHLRYRVESRRTPILAHQAPRRCKASLPFFARQTPDATRPETHPGDEPAAPRGRPFRNRPLAWPRIDRNHRHLSASRHATQRTGAGHDPHVRRKNTPLPPR